MIEIYTRSNCPLCVATKSFLVEKQVEYVEYVLGQDIMKEDLLQKFPHAKVVPIIMINGYQIAGLSELKTIVNSNQLGAF